MAYKITSIKPLARSGSARRRGFALTEMLFAMGIGTLLTLVVCAFALYSSRSFVVLSNYVELDDANRLAVDQLTSDLRQCRNLVAATTNSITLEDSDGVNLTYSYSPSLHTLSRVKGTVSKVLLTECENLVFALGQRNPVGGTYDVYPVATPNTAKVVNVSWVCSREVMGVKANTESVQTARIVIRKQGT